MREDGQNFSGRLIAWQKQHGRHDLPWQNTREAYRIWLSEIMLQQTQVGTVIPYYARFMERFPTVEALASAPLESVLEAWSGLGYYARARNLHRCAQTVVERFAGKFPSDCAALAELPGIGRSTAAAIAAFSFAARAPILDGNVKRVLTRCFGIDGYPGTAVVERRLWALAEDLLPDDDIEAYTQGLMDLGATLCTRHQPACAECPLGGVCLARRQGRQGELPAGRPGKRLPEREADLVLLSDGRRILFERRPPTGIWGGLLSLPELGGADPVSFAARHGCRLLERHPLPPVRHAFTHFRLTLRTQCCRVEAQAAVAAEAGWEWVDVERIDRAALPAPIRKLLKGQAGEGWLQAASAPI